MDFSGGRFLEELASGVAAGLVVAYLVYRFIESKLHLRQRDETATTILQAIDRDLDWNQEQLDAFSEHLTPETMPYPGVSIDGWTHLNQAAVITAIRPETVAALLPAYARLRTIQDLYELLWDMRQGRTRALAQAVLVSQGTDEAEEGIALYRNHGELLRGQLLDRIEELKPWLDDARKKTKDELASRGKPPAPV
jgi:hypothetical protein